MSGGNPPFVTGKCIKNKHWQCHNSECKCSCHRPKPKPKPDKLELFDSGYSKGHKSKFI